ncbi:SMI1/KNR4 family protein [Deinococcus sp. AJ005]|uniref:SMI1/KNR4 family protein n=1 Tax=Deinococcus sp. AJ005 TaxID=2652443 RepID=UPI00125CAD94|nr:SMI1/KNR4 family protein [Deinococcus sp. AJ005]QFP75313.1 SMI1/KNR4 family protein [Deinococcus sp. AJ005]
MTKNQPAATYIQQFWNEFEQWILSQEDGEDVLELLLPGASQSELNQAEHALEFALPVDFREFYSRHNGAHFWPDEEELLTLENALSETMMRRSAVAKQADLQAGETDLDENGVFQTWWHKRWLLFIRDGGGNGVAIQCGAPESSGQVIYVDHETGQPSSESSLSNYLEGIVALIRQDWYVVKDGTVMSRELLDEDDEDYAEDLDSWLEMRST